MIIAAVVLQEGGEALQESRTMAGTARGCLLGAKYICKLCQGLALHTTLYIPACATSPFRNSIQAAGSAGRCVCPGPNSALLSSPAVRTACRICTQLFIHKTNASVDSAQEITTQRCTQAACTFCCCSANQIRFPCCLIHFALIKSKFRNEGNSSPLWER